MKANIYFIIVTYNGFTYIESCIESIHSNGFGNESIICIDNHSSDGTIDLLESYAGLDLIKLERNVGFGQANNLAIESAIGKGAEYIFLLNQDGILGNNCIDILIECSKKYHVDIYSPLHFNRCGKLDYAFKNYVSEVKEDWKNPRRELENVDFVNAAFWLVPVATFKKIGTFDALFFHYGEDVNLIDRLHYHKLSLAVVYNAKAIHDREQEYYNPKMASNFQYWYRTSSAVMVELLNINYPLARQASRAFKILLVSYLAMLKSLRFKKSLIALMIVLETIVKLKKIIHSRKSSKIRIN